MANWSMIRSFLKYISEMKDTHPHFGIFPMVTQIIPPMAQNSMVRYAIGQHAA